jgi:hypothetical protein
MEQGVQIELCGATAAANHWGNADLLPGVKVNTNAMVRVHLSQAGNWQPARACSASSIRLSALTMALAFNCTDRTCEQPGAAYHHMVAAA